jgi:hypothetical protein
VELPDFGKNYNLLAMPGSPLFGSGAQIIFPDKEKVLLVV